MALNLMNPAVRMNLLKEIKGEENRQRKAESLKQFEIYSDRQHKWVKDHLLSQFSPGTVAEMPIVSSINLARRIVNQQATIYKNAPERMYTNLSEEQVEVLGGIYADMMADQKLDKSNKRYKLQNQNLIQILPKNGKLVMRVYLQHHYDVIPTQDDPETADVVIINSFDKFDNEPSGTTTLNGPISGEGSPQSALYSDGVDQSIADHEDYKASLERYVVWSREFNFMMDGKGRVLSGSVDSPIPGVLPFIDVAGDKDFEYFNRQGQSVTDFSVQYNSAMSDLANIVRMQGWGQGYLIAENGTIPQNLQVGPNYILRLPISENSQIRPEFGYANASPDLEGSIKYVEMLLSNFLSSRGLDPKIISGNAESTRYSSGIERLLSMIEKFEASQEDYQVYGRVEQEAYTLVKAWHNGLRGTDLLLLKYQTADFPEDSRCEPKFKRPELVQTESEKLDWVQSQRETGLMSRVEAIMLLRGVTEEKAEEIAAKIDQDDISLIPPTGGSDGGSDNEETRS